MSVNSPTKPGYAIAVPLIESKSFPVLLTLNINEVAFQMQWTAGLATGVITLYASNQDLPVYGSASDVLQPPPLAPVKLASIDVATAPYVTDHSGAINVSCGYSWCWIHYEGIGGGSLSIAYTGKSWG